MKNLLRVASAPLALLLAGGAAMAADLPAPAPVYKAPPPPAPFISWTGFYLGAGAGNGIWTGRTSVQSPTGAPLSGNNTQGGEGWLASAVTGYDYQVGDRVVVGVLGNFDYGDLKSNFSDPTTSASGVMKERSSWSAGARVGWLFNPELLGFISGGYSQAHFSGVGLSTAGASVGTLPSHTYNGWFVGTGLETTFPLLGNGWFMRTDYRFAQYNSASLAETGVGGAITNIQSVHPYVQTASAELIYKFNSNTGAGSGTSFASMLSGFFAPPGPDARWTGFYVAGGGGYGTWSGDTSSQSAAGAPISGIGTEGGRGWFGTANIGYDYQLTSRIVTGIFADGDLADIKGTFQDQNTAGGSLAGSMTERGAWAGGARGGWLISPQILSYYDVGFTQASFSGVGLSGNTAATTLPGASLGSHTYNGWFLGSGLEMPLSFLGNGWFARAEYRYSEFRSAALPEVTAGGATRDFVVFRPYVQTVRTELVYRF